MVYIKCISPITVEFRTLTHCSFFCRRSYFWATLKTSFRGLLGQITKKKIQNIKCDQKCYPTRHRTLTGGHPCQTVPWPRHFEVDCKKSASKLEFRTFVLFVCLSAFCLWNEIIFCLTQKSLVLLSSLSAIRCLMYETKHSLLRASQSVTGRHGTSRTCPIL